MAFRIRDPIYNFVLIPDEFQGIVNCGALQRLRGIKQLALASLAYPGALHTRFDHTLGVTHVAGMMCQTLGLNADERRLVELAALLHDVGHGPFSHVSEASLSRFANRSALKTNQNDHKIHELVTAQIIRTDPELCQLIPEGDREDVIKLLSEGVRRPVLKQIVSGPLDADKQDYLLRDSRFCGVEYGSYDIQQMHRSLVVVGEGRDDEELMIEQDGVHAVEQFALAKYYMTANVYRHRVRLISDQMIGRGIRLGIEQDRVPELKRLYEYDGTGEFIRNYQQWDDGRFMEVFCPMHCEPPGALSGEMFRRLRERRLLKQVFSTRVESFDGRIREVISKQLLKPSCDSTRQAIEAEVAELLAEKLGQTVVADYVIVNVFGIKSVRESSRNEDAEILVRTGDAPRPFSEESRLFGSINEAFADNFIEVYAPIDWPNVDLKNELKQTWEAEIREVVKKHCLEAKRKTT